MPNAAVEHVLSETVRSHRFTIAVVFPIVGAIVILTSARGWLPAPVSFNPLLLLFGAAIMRLPLIAGLLPVVDRRAAVVLVALAGYTWAVEFVGVSTGLPYGTFEYGIQLGPMIHGVPLALPLFFVPLVLNAYLLVLVIAPRATRRIVVRLPLAIGAVIAIDLVLDPAAVAVGFWSFDAGGRYYGVPWTNYAGWVLSGTIAVLAVEIAFSRTALYRRIDRCEYILDDMVSFTLLWGTINLVFGNWIPVVLTGLFVSGLAVGNRLPIQSPNRLRHDPDV